MGQKDHDPFDGYRPDMDQYREDPEFSDIGRDSRFPPGWWAAAGALVCVFLVGIGAAYLIGWTLAQYIPKG